MAKTSVVPKKKRGPPPTGKGIQIGMRWPAKTIASVDAWAALEANGCSRPEAIRRLVELGLKVKGK
jgi:hypothetical protein